MLADFFDRIGNNFQKNFDAAGPEGLASLGAAIASAPRNQWGSGLAQGLAGFGQAAKANKKKASLAEALKGAMGQYTPEQQAFLGALEPDQAAGILGGNMFPKAPMEKWVDLGNGKQQNVITGKVDDIPLSLADREKLARAGASTTNINTYPAEIGARAGMASGFMNKYESIIKDVPTLHTVQGRAQMLFNTGRGGEIKREVKSGVDALTKQMTGAGMPVAEAEDYASRYIISELDTDFDMRSKLKGLKYDLENVGAGIAKARGMKENPISGGGGGGDWKIEQVN